MSSTATVQSSTSRRARSAPSGRLPVGDYVGHPAAQAAQAVRRAGLRPGLDRSFGCEAALTGLVVAQEPPAGDELARNGMVTLYVAAPDRARPAESGQSSDGGVDAQTGAREMQAPTPVALADRQTRAGARRARKRRPAAAASSRMFEEPPAPQAPIAQAAGGECTSEQRAPITEPSQTQSCSRPPHGEGLDHAAFEGHDEHELPHEEFVVHTEDLFTGRHGDPRRWRRVYPRRPGGRGMRAALAWAGGHRVLAAAAGAALTIWIASAVLAPITWRSPHRPAAGARPQTVPGALEASTSTARRSRPAVLRPPASTTRTSRPPRTASLSVPRARAASRSPTGASSVQPSVPPAGASPPPDAPPAGATRTPPPEQAGGGPFSP